MNMNRNEIFKDYFFYIKRVFLNFHLVRGSLLFSFGQGFLGHSFRRIFWRIGILLFAIPCLVPKALPCGKSPALQPASEPAPWPPCTLIWTVIAHFLHTHWHTHCTNIEAGGFSVFVGVFWGIHAGGIFEGLGLSCIPSLACLQSATLLPESRTAHVPLSRWRKRPRAGTLTCGTAASLKKVAAVGPGQREAIPSLLLPVGPGPAPAQRWHRWAHVPCPHACIDQGKSHQGD